MNNAGYVQQVIWGTSLKMASDDEIKECYEIIKNHLKTQDEYDICDQAKLKKIDSINTFLTVNPKSSSVAWLCDMTYSNTDLCNTKPSISFENLESIVNNLVADDININLQTIVNSFLNAGYIVIYQCNRILFTK